MKHVYPFEVRRTMKPFQVEQENMLKSLRSQRRVSIFSLYEGYALLLKQLEGFKQEAFKVAVDRDYRAMANSLICLAALCQRTAEDMRLTTSVVENPLETVPKTVMDGYADLERIAELFVGMGLAEWTPYRRDVFHDLEATLCSLYIRRNAQLSTELQPVKANEVES